MILSAGRLRVAARFNGGMLAARYFSRLRAHLGAGVIREGNEEIRPWSSIFGAAAVRLASPTGREETFTGSISSGVTNLGRNPAIEGRARNCLDRLVAGPSHATDRKGTLFGGRMELLLRLVELQFFVQRMIRFLLRSAPRSGLINEPVFRDRSPADLGV
jgi:hypothetical protein